MRGGGFFWAGSLPLASLEPHRRSIIFREPGSRIKNQKVVVRGEVITGYRVDLKVTFSLRGE